MSRIVLLLALLSCLCAVGSAETFAVSGLYTHRERITESAHTYRIETGGTADMDNTSTRLHGAWEIAFQNNLSLTIANTGATPVENPRVIMNDRGRWHTWQAMLAEFTRGAKDAQERIYLVYEGLRQNRHHDYPLFGDDEYHDPVRFLNVYGGGFCDDSGKVGSALFYGAGFNAQNGGEDPFVRALHGHMMCEVWHAGDFQWIDIDQDTFFLDRDCAKPVSGDTAAHDHEYAKREQAYGPMFTPWDAGPHTNASLFGIDDDRSPRGVLGHEMGYTLRPGERYVFRWDNIGKYPWQREDIEHRYYGNSRIEYEPPLTASARAFEPAEMAGFERGAAGLAVVAPEAVLAVHTETPYTVCGAAVRLEYRALPEGGALALACGPEGGRKHVWTSEGGGEGVAEVALDAVLGVAGGPARRDYRVWVEARNAAGCVLTALALETDLYAYPIALPRLRAGENAVEYTDDTPGPHEVMVTHEWRESDSVRPPTPPAAPVAPEPGATVSATTVRFAWPGSEGCTAYHLRVSRDPELRYPYRPNYDVIIDKTEYEAPYRGMFRPGDTYYWRVRPRLASGMWGDWSPVWTFSWDGPMPPREVRLVRQGYAWHLVWEPNPLGRTPAYYEVYGSDEKGFTVHKEPRVFPGRGEAPGNFYASSGQTSLPVVDAKLDRVNANRAFYRVVAIDKAGVESGPSDYAASPRPYIYSWPETEARVGDAWAYNAQCIESIGDLQSRYVDPGHGYFEREAYHWELAEGPDWLALDADTGVLSGTPDAPGEVRVELRLRVSYPHEVPVDSKSGKEFQVNPLPADATARQVFVLHVAPGEGDR